MSKAERSKKYWHPHIGGMPHEGGPSGETYCIQIRVPREENADEYVALTDFTLDYTEAQKWLAKLREKAGRYLMQSRMDQLS